MPKDSYVDVDSAVSSVPESSEKAESPTKIKNTNTTYKNRPATSKNTRTTSNTKTTVKVIRTTADAQTTTNEATKATTTTSKPTTQSQIETTTEPTTRPVATTPPTTQEKVPSGTFTFTVYGFGHGVGMSQWGAIYKAREGMNYVQILKHYYPGVTIEKDETLPEKVKFGGVEYSLEEYLYRSTFAEIGTSSNPVDAIKANVVAIYTLAKKRNFIVQGDLHAFEKSPDLVTSYVKSAVDSVIGEYITYNGVPINALFFSMSAGRTISAKSAWGGTSYPYLIGVDSSVDLQHRSCKTVRTISSQDLKAKIKDKTGIELTGDPSTWLQILSHDGTVNKNLGYVDKIRVGNKTYSGIYFRETIMGGFIRSHCFNFTYTPD